MSRSSKGFADFFPTAPSVLQQKRSKPPQSRRKRPGSCSGEDSGLPPPETLPQEPLGPRAPQKSGEERLAVNGTGNGHQRVERISSFPDDADTTHGDLLNGVGSASSTSTSSSLFSMNQNPRGMMLKNGSADLTPLTHVDSSPPHSSAASPEWKYSHSGATPKREPPDLVTQESINSRNQASSSAVCTSSAIRSHTCPGRGEWKGVKVIYDPELDDSLSREEKKGRKIKEVSFRAQVG